MPSNSNHADEFAPPMKPVVILGGGVNGAAVLRELALNNVTAILLETADFCQGASGASTRMAHGGLRYLEQREFALVKEATRERNLLLKNACHVTRPMLINVPLENLYHGAFGTVCRFLGLSTKKHPLNLCTLKFALLMYEFIGRKDNCLQKHRVYAGRNELPPSARSEYRALLTYWDGCFTQPESLVLEMLVEARKANEHTDALNYASWHWTGNGFNVESMSNVIEPCVIVNATGAWVDTVNAQLGLRTNYVKPVRGAHLVIDNQILHARMNGEAYYFDDGQGRMVIAYPLERTVLMGTTEVASDVSQLDVITHDEILYLKQSLSRLFSDIQIHDHEIVAVTTSARPIRNVDAADANAASREHEVVVDKLQSELPVFTLIGGKWTTFRSFAETVTDKVLEHLGKTRAVSTSDLHYPGTPDCSLKGPESARDQLLFNRYGACWTDVAQFCDRQSDRMLKHVIGYSHREIKWLVKERSAARLDDIFLRRTTLAINGKATREALMEVAVVLSPALNKSDEWAAAEVERCVQLSAIHYDHGVTDHLGSGISRTPANE